MENRLNRVTRSNIDHYIARLNIEHYKKMLETEIDEITRQTVTRLLAEEHANLIETIPKAIVREAEKDPDQKRAVNGYK
jgi:molybdopterin synthase catalytic subunit